MRRHGQRRYIAAKMVSPAFAGVGHLSIEEPGADACIFAIANTVDIQIFRARIFRCNQIWVLLWHLLRGAPGPQTLAEHGRSLGR